MNEVFDLERERYLLRGPVGFAHYLSWSFDEAVGKRSLSQSGSMLVGMAVNCVIVGFNDEASELLRKAKEWLEYAIGTQEKNRDYFHGGTEAWRHENLALCNWLLRDCHDRENLEAAIRWQHLYYSEDKPIKADVAPTFPVYIDAAEYALVVALFERLWGRKRPANVRRITGEAAMSYVIAVAKLHREYSDEEVKAGAESFLRVQVPKLLEHGNYVAVARWMKIIHWNDNPERRSAFETVQKCYDYLPNVSRPKST